MATERSLEHLRSVASRNLEPRCHRFRLYLGEGIADIIHMVWPLEVVELPKQHSDSQSQPDGESYACRAR